MTSPAQPEGRAARGAPFCVTLIALDELRPNPHRNFDLYPLDEEHVERLRQSIEKDGFFASVTARAAPGGGKGYELAAGHHRIEAARRAGLTHVEVNVQPYDDAAMVRIMIRENTGQRGHAAAALDSVAAQARLTAFAVLAAEKFDPEDEDLSNMLVTSGVTSQKSLETARASVVRDGPGARLLYRAINGFAKADRREHKDAEQMTSTAIEDALKRLKASGVMARIVAEAHAKAAAAIAGRRETEKWLAREAEKDRKLDDKQRRESERKAGVSAIRKAKAARRLGSAPTRRQRPTGSVPARRPSGRPRRRARLRRSRAGS